MAEVAGDASRITAKTVFDAARKGDILARKIISDVLSKFAMGVANAIVLFNPDLVVIGGGISRAGEVLLEPLRRELEKLVPIMPKIITSSLGDQSALVGAFHLVMRNIDLLSFVAL